MKRIFVLSLILILCVGCTRIDNIDNYDVVVDKIVNSNFNHQNTTSLGYTYYLPLDVSKVYDKDYNQKLKVDDTFMYLYVDVVSYYYKNALNLDEVDTLNNYYYHKINSNGKTGYIKITEEDGTYFVKIVYNYAKIESYVSKTKIEDILANGMIILNSINYNDNLIEKILEDEFYSGVDKKYNIEKPSNAESKFSEYLSEYVQDEDNQISDLPEY